MIEQHWKGITVGVQKLAEPDEGGSTYRMVVIDGYTDADGNLEPGSGSGQILWLYFDDQVAKTIHEATGVGSRVVKPKLVIPRGRVK